MRSRHPRGQRRVGDRLHELSRARPLDGEHRVVIQPVVSPRHRRSPSACVLKPGEVALVVGRVRHRQIAIGLQPIGEEVVEHAAVLAAQHGVLRTADRDLRRRRWRAAAAAARARRAPQFRSRPCARRRRRPRSRAPPCAPRPDADVLDRHLPAGELDELRARGDVAIKQGCAPERRIGRCRHRPQAIEGLP